MLQAANTNIVLLLLHRPSERLPTLSEPSLFMLTGGTQKLLSIFVIFTVWFLVKFHDTRSQSVHFLESHLFHSWYNNNTTVAKKHDIRSYFLIGNDFLPMKNSLWYKQTRLTKYIFFRSFDRGLNFHFKSLLQFPFIFNKWIIWLISISVTFTCQLQLLLIYSMKLTSYIINIICM